LHLLLRPPVIFLGAIVLLSGPGVATGVHAQSQAPPPSQQPPSQIKKAPPGPAAPLSKHFPILLLAFGPATGDDPAWSVRIGQKGPERLDRYGYPPVPLDPVDVNREGTSDAWNYRAKDSATGAELTVHLTREACSPDASGTKYTFTAAVQHAQIGSFTGCARIAAELFPKITNQTSDDDDTDPKKPPPPLPADIIAFKAPVAFAYLNLTGKVVVGVGAIKKIAAPAGSELALSHDGKKLLYTRDDSKTSPQRTIVLYDFDTGRSKDLIHGLVRRAFWSPDDTRVAFLYNQDQKWQVWTLPISAPETPTALYTNDVTSLHGWSDAHNLLASDLENAYWIGEDGAVVLRVALKEIYGPAFDITSSDTFRTNPTNPSLLLVSASYVTAPAGAPKDSNSIAAGFFYYELRSKRRVVLSQTDEWGRAAEWSRDGVQIFYTRRASPTTANTFRMLWDASGSKKYIDGTEFVVGK
jgi:uncharacterized membrane protein